MITLSERLRNGREIKGLTTAQVAQRLGISLSDYEDIEAYDNEVEGNISLGRLLTLIHQLDLSPGELFPGNNVGIPLPFEGLRQAIEAHLQKTGLERDAFEELVGWSIEGPLIDPRGFSELTLDALKDITKPLRIEWFDVVEAEFRLGL